MRGKRFWDNAKKMGREGFHKGVSEGTQAYVKAKEKEKRAAEDVLPGGKGDNQPDSKFSKKQLKKGIKHEAEHTKSPEIKKEIAKDHLTEDPKYYTHLDAVEKMQTNGRQGEEM